MNIDSKPDVPEGRDVPPASASHGSQPRYDDIALRAYFIALDRHRRGEEVDPLKDWVEAERQLSA